MTWREWMQQGVEMDEVDREAVRRAVQWQRYTASKAPRETFLDANMDPDMENEFCYYPIAAWDRLISFGWKNYQKVDGIDFAGRLTRAVLIKKVGVDPQEIGDVMNRSNELQERVFATITGGMMLELYQKMAAARRQAGVDTPPFEQVTFFVFQNAENMMVSPTRTLDFMPEEDYVRFDSGFLIECYRSCAEQQQRPRGAALPCFEDTQFHLFLSRKVIVELP